MAGKYINGQVEKSVKSSGKSPEINRPGLWIHSLFMLPDAPSALQVISAGNPRAALPVQSCTSSSLEASNTRNAAIVLGRQGTVQILHFLLLFFCFSKELNLPRFPSPASHQGSRCTLSVYLCSQS